MKDMNGNEMTVIVKNENGKIIHTIEYTLEPGATTIRGDYPKQANPDCPFKERLDCNSGPGYHRCPYMKCIKVGIWHCIYKKSP